MTRNINKTKSTEIFPTVLTFLIILLTFLFKNYRIVLYTFEVVYILVFSTLAYKNNYRLNSLVIWAALFFFVCIISTIYSVDMYNSLKLSINVLKGLLVGISLHIFLSEKPENLEVVIKSIIISAFFTAILIFFRTPLYDYGSSRLGDVVRLNPNDLGMKMAVATIVSYYYGFKKNKIVNFSFAILFLVLSLLTGSRKVVLLIVASLIIISIFSIANLKKFFKVLSFGSLFLVIVIFAAFKVEFFFNIIGYRIEYLINGLILSNGEIDGSLSTRHWMIEQGIIMFQQRPLQGFGIGSYEVLKHTSYSHNNFVEILVGVGLLGFIVYYSFYILIIKRLMNKITTDDHAVLALALFLPIIILEIGVVTYYVEFYLLLLSVFYYISNPQAGGY